MSATTIARRYAEAMADVAIAHNVVDQIDNELRTLAEMMRQSRELANVFASPVLPQQDKGNVLEAIIARTRLGAYTANLLRTMLTHHRLPLIAEVDEQYRRIINERRGVVVAEVTTALPLDAGEQAQLSQRLQAITGKRVEFKFKTDAGLIGGVVTRIGSVVYDGSVRTQLQEIHHQLKSGTRG
jgi:F-type H+-transporting ATPase subunit delta